MTRNEQVVRRFLDAWAAKDVDACRRACDSDSVHQSTAGAGLGLSNVRKIIKAILDLTHKVEWKLSNVFGRGNTVCTERLDCWDFDGKGRGVNRGAKLPYVGMLDLDEQGKIIAWRNLLR